MPKNPLVEVFGYPVDNMLPVAVNHRNGKLCPFHNSSGINCTKSSATDPLGVCTIVDGNDLAITCPVRFRQDYLIIADAAEFFFPGHRRYVSLTEVRLKDGYHKSAGNIDIVIVALDDNDQIMDFGALEIQAVYISGNVKKPFKHYMQNPEQNYNMQWQRRPRADYLSSSRKRLAPQLIYKGGILNQWKKKTAVAVHRPFFRELPKLPSVSPAEADIAWFIYDLEYNSMNQQYQLVRSGVQYTKFQDALDVITTAEPGNVNDFIRVLRSRIQKGQLMGIPPASELSPTVEPPITIPDLEEE